MMISIQKHFTVLLAFLSSLTLIMLNGCAASEIEQGFEHSEEVRFTEGDKTFTFTDEFDGKSSKWLVVFKDDEIRSIYRDGVKIPDEEIETFEHLIYKNLPLSSSTVPFYSFRMKEFAPELKNFGKNFKIFRDSMPDFSVHFDREAFKERMEKFKEKMSAMKDHKIKFKFDREKIRDEMKKLRERLKENKDFRIEINTDDFIPDPDEPYFDFDGFDFDFEIPEINLYLENLNEKLRGIDIRLRDVDVNLKKLGSFIEELKSELVKDKLIDDIDSKLDLELSKDEMVLNGTKLSEEHYLKYRQIYIDHFGKEPEEKIKLKIK